MTKIRHFSFLCIIFLASCSVQRVVKPLSEKQVQVQATLGGPLIGFSGTTIPTPLSSLGIAYGLNANISLFGGIHTTSLAYQDLQLDIGITHGFMEANGWKPGISGSFSLNPILDFRDNNFRIYPQLDLNVYWDYADKHFMYLGTTNWIEMRNALAHGFEQDKHWLSGIQFGNTFNTDKWAFTIESKWLAPTRNTESLIVDYKTYSVGGEKKGAVGLYLGIARSF